MRKKIQINSIEQISKLLQSTHGDPESKKELFSEVLDNTTFQRVVRSRQDFKTLVDCFPEPGYKEALFQKALEDEIFRWIVRSVYDFKNLIDCFPEPGYKEALFQKAFEGATFQRIVKFSGNFKNLIDCFREPEYKERLFQKVLADEIVKRIGIGVAVLHLKWFPEPKHKEQLFQKALEDTTFQRISRLMSDLKGLIDCFPEPKYKKQLLQKALEDTSFQAMLRSVSDLKDLIDCFPEPKYKEQLFQKALNDTTFQRIVTCQDDLNNFIDSFPEPKHKEQMLQKVLEDKTFQRLITNAWHVRYLIYYFPEHKEILIKKMLGGSLGFKDQASALYEKFDRINAGHFDEFQKKDPTEFFLMYKMQINFLVEVMGEAAFKWMSDQLAQTVLPLERLLNEMPHEIPGEITAFLKHYFSEHSNELIKRENLELWKNIIIGLKANYDYELNSSGSVDNLTIFLGPYREFSGSPKEFSVFINDRLLDAIFKSMQLSEEVAKSVNRDQLFSSLPINKFAQLSLERLRLKQDSSYGNVLDALINCYLTQQSVDTFLHDLNQDSVLGKQLAVHNNNIQSEFKAHQIDVEKALHYNKTYEFSLLPHKLDIVMEKTRSMEVLCDFLKVTIDEMLCSITLLQAERKTASEGQKSAIDLLIIKMRVVEKSYKQFTKDAKAPLQRYEKTHWPLLTTIRDLLTSLLHDEIIREGKQFTSLREFLTHFIDQYVIAEKKLKVVTPKASELKSAYFRVEQWDKEKISTLFLGNEVDCCLGVGSTQFQAIVQRIMDDAMQFHVVIDLETNKPIALTWLYFAEDAEKNIFLTGNFIEIKAKYGSNDYARETIVNALLYFTGELYCRDVGVKQFIINELTYGWCAEKLTYFSKEVVRLTDKVGGAFIPAENYDYQSPQELTSSRYYLASLSRAVSTPAPEFYIYKPEAITPEKRRDFMSLENRIETMFMSAFADYKKCNASIADIAIIRAIEPDVRKAVIALMGIFFEYKEDDQKLTAILETVKAKHFAGMIQNASNLPLDHAASEFQSNPISFFKNKTSPDKNIPSTEIHGRFGKR